MGSINALSSAFYDPSISRALVPVQPASQGAELSRRPTPTPPLQAIIPTGDIRSGLESRASLIFQQSLTDDGVSSRNRQAIRAYRIHDEAEEREQVSRLLGVDEYA
ncbi:MAG: hypothetical protein OQK42_08115 [Sedimenticola sp.]|nr:hypothetical protein [Sedimenticola sp.]